MVQVFDIATIAEDFPILQETVHGKRLVYFDNAATTQKPKMVLNALRDFYEHDNSNVHRGLHLLAMRADKAYDEARAKVAKFINAKESREIVFVRGTTEAINLVAQSYGRTQLHRGAKIVSTVMEHHSNIVPWQLLKDSVSIHLREVPVLDSGELDMHAYKALLQEKPKLVAITHVSNVLGTVNPVKEMVAMAHEVGSLVLVDGAQAIAHMPVDVQDLDADFYVFSGHKMYGPTGIGVLYAKSELLEKMPPYQGGGGMIETVSFEETTYASHPTRFEAGTPNIAGAVGLGAAVDFLTALGLENVYEHEQLLLKTLVPQLEEVPGVHLIGNPRQRVGVVSFVVDGVHPHDVGTALDLEGVAIRAGHHCAMPLMHRFKVPATARASFGVYNSREEIEIFLRSINNITRFFKNG